MTIINEYRFPMPVSIEEYPVGQLYAVMHASRQETGEDTAIEIIENRPFFNEAGLSSGQYTHKIYHIGKRLPTIIRALAPASMLKIEERSWNAYPKISMVVTNQFLGNRFEIHVESNHLDDRGDSENVFELGKEDLAKRSVIKFDIGSDLVKGSHTKGAEKYDPASFKSEKTGRGPLIDDWIETSKPVMCAYRLVKIKFNVFGLQSRLEKLVDSVERNFYLQFHKQIFTLIDEWYGLTMDEIRTRECQLKHDLDAAMDNMNIETRENMGIKEIPTNAEKNRNRSPFDSNQASEIVSNQEEKSLSHSAYHRH